MSTPTVQLGFVGVFPADYESPAKKLSLQRQGSFSPDTDDFIAVLKQCKHIKPEYLKDKKAQTPTIGELLSKISRTNGVISRIDLHTHAGYERVGLSGSVWARQVQGVNLHHVYFADDPSGSLLMWPNLERTLLTEMMEDDQAKEALNKARQKFTTDSEFHIYGCNAGIAPAVAKPLGQLIADALRVKTYLFLAEVGYDFKENGKWGFHLRYIVGRDPKTGMPKEELTDVVDDYRDLDKLTQHITSHRPTQPIK